MTDTMLDRDLRQRGLVPPDTLAQCQATVIGVGAIGRHVALQLAAMGVPKLQLMDHDVVEVVNLAPQGYLEADLGRTKVDATADLCRQLHPRIEVEALQHRFRRSGTVCPVVFCCVDSIDTRRLIWEAVQDQVQFFVDGRMTAEVIRVLTAGDAAGREHYPTTLFDGRTAFTGACTARSTIYCSNIAAGLMVAQFAKWLRRLPLDPDLMLNLTASEWSAMA